MNKVYLFNCTPHFSRVFCTVKKIHNKIHYCKNFIFDRFWTFLDILAKIRKKSENPEFVFSTQWKKCFFYSVEKMFFTLSRKNRLFFNLSRKNRVFYKWDKLKNKLSTLSKCGLQSNNGSLFNSMYNKLWDQFSRGWNLVFWPPQVQESYTERSVLRNERSEWSKAKRGIQFLNAWRSKN